MNTKILVCCHKKDICADDRYYLPIHVGKAVSTQELGILGDDKGENISDKNDTYCELTGLYWAWKNLKDTRIIGLCHYRRYFDFHNQCKKGFPLTEFDTRDFDKIDKSISTDIINKINEGYVVVPKQQIISPLFIHYALHHRSEDLVKLRKIVVQKSEKKYIDAFDAFFYKNNKIHPFNMFIMRWDMFCNYCTWLFDIIIEFEKEIDLTSYDSYQRRIYGFVAERLFNIYLLANNFQIIQKPILSFTDDKLYYGRSNSYLSYFLRCKVQNFYNYLSSNLKL